MGEPATTSRRTFRVTGQVQGVGFRPFVYRIATGLGLTGTVRNDSEGVTIDAAGDPELLDELSRRLTADAPALALVDEVEVLEGEGAPEFADFRIVASDGGESDRGRVTVDTATCPECVAELRDPADRRHGHPFVNCTNCGPRYTIVRDLPYDRPVTTMAAFPMCEACAREYADPADRRFHAQPVCCPDCGPRLDRPIGEVAAALEVGEIVAIKGLGGYHLAVDATDEAAVGRLRRRKRRDDKPFAVMVPDLGAARKLAVLSPAGERALASPESPIVLAPARGNDLAPSVAKGSHRLGLMLPHTPIQHLLLDALGRRPLVMTSGNVTDDPLLKDDDEARESLGDIADRFLAHDRPIERAVDDSILIDAPFGLLPIRRARGLVPAPIPLPVAAERPGLAVGGELKGTVAVVRGAEAVLSQHLGDLTFALAYRRFLKTVEDLGRLYDTPIEWIATDLHPDYRAHRWAAAKARELDVPLVTVQHHHAHLASLLAEHGLDDRVIGIVCDGVGYGDDGEAWGGEILAGDLEGYERLGRLRPIRLPGGDVATKRIDRLAVSWIEDAVGAGAVPEDLAEREETLSLLATGLRCPGSSGAGRLFDAAAALLKITPVNTYEAMSGILLEAAASRGEKCEFGLIELTLGEAGEPFELDHRPLARWLLRQRFRGRESITDLARAFHEALAYSLALGAIVARERTGISVAGLTGGVFANTLLTGLLKDRLEAEGFTVLVHRLVPPNDGGIALGQAAVAAAVLAGEER